VKWRGTFYNLRYRWVIYIGVVLGMSATLFAFWLLYTALPEDDPSDVGPWLGLAAAVICLIIIQLSRPFASGPATFTIEGEDLVMKRFIWTRRYVLGGASLAVHEHRRGQQRVVLCLLTGPEYELRIGAVDKFGAPMGPPVPPNLWDVEMASAIELEQMLGPLRSICRDVSPHAGRQA
jgi:hypothetical protein